MSKVRVRDRSELWREGLAAIDNNIEALRDDLVDKGWDNENAIRSVLNAERAEMVAELSRNIDGDFSHPYVQQEYVDLNNIEYPDAIISPEERMAAEEGVSDEYDGEPISASELSTNEPLDVSIPEEIEETDGQEEEAKDLIEDTDVAHTEDSAEQEEQADELIEESDEEHAEDSSEQEEQASDLSQDTADEESSGEDETEYQGYSY